MNHVVRPHGAERIAHLIGRRAVSALHAELVLYPKPGLVSPFDSGAHDDMDAGTFMRSLFALRHYFQRITEAGARGAPFSELQALGIAAEARMLAATGGINTHRGAVFCMGLLAAAAGWRLTQGLDLTPEAWAQTIATRWGEAIAATGPAAAPESHGRRAVARFRARGAREEVLAGMPTLMKIAVPTLHRSLAATGCPERARVQTLFAVMAELDDTNLLHRGGREGLDFVRDRARAFLCAGGVMSSHWREKASELHRQCIERRLSPGGSADILAAAVFVHGLAT
jgi:triphosphoribosyl-dephospho-CoA synthase